MVGWLLMGGCSYCRKYRMSSHDECFGWDQARNYCGISGPDDPQRKINKAAEDSLTAKEKQARRRLAEFMRNYEQ